jgi:asparagine synthase (glutamine-hydrolysing)
LAYDTGVRVLLSGEGADELFGGYVSRYRWLAVRKLMKARGVVVSGLLNRAVVGSSRLLSKLTGARPPWGRGLGLHEVLCGGLRRQRMLEDALASAGVLSDPLDRELAAELATDLQTYLLPILHRTDRASMMASIEARVPFLDEEVVALAQRLPPSLKFKPRGLRIEGKAILKQVAERHLPRSIVYRPKMGFQIPAAYYEHSLPRSWLGEGFVVKTFGLKQADVQCWFDSNTDRGRWMLLALEIWGQMFVQGRSPADVEAEYLANCCAERPIVTRSVSGT